jgi:hypothetical protein
MPERVAFAGSADQFLAFVGSTGLAAVPWGALAALVANHGLSLNRGDDGLIHMNFDAVAVPHDPKGNPE